MRFKNFSILWIEKIKTILQIAIPIFVVFFIQTLLSSLEEVMGSTFSDKQKERFWNQMGIVLKAHVGIISYLFH